MRRLVLAGLLAGGGLAAVGAGAWTGPDAPTERMVVADDLAVTAETSAVDLGPVRCRAVLAALPREVRTDPDLRRGGPLAVVPSDETCALGNREGRQVEVFGGRFDLADQGLQVTRLRRAAGWGPVAETAYADGGATRTYESATDDPPFTCLTYRVNSPAVALAVCDAMRATVVVEP